MEFTATAECVIMGSLNIAGSRLSGRIKSTLSENGLWYPPMQDISPICASGGSRRNSAICSKRYLNINKANR